MRKIFLLFASLYLLLSNLSAQKYEPVTVRAGMKVGDCFPYNERYRFSEFTTGKILLKSGISSAARLNYDFLSAEVVFIRNRDTLALVNPRDLRLVTIGQDTFYYDRGFYFESLTSGPVRIGLKQYIKLKETQQKDSYGTTSSGAAVSSYGALPSQGNFYKLTANADMLFQRTLEYYIFSEGEYIPVNRKNLMRIFPGHETEIKTYLKTKKVSFDERDDMLNLAEFLRGL